MVADLDILVRAQVIEKKSRQTLRSARRHQFPVRKIIERRFFEDFVDNTLENVEKFEVVQQPDSIRTEKRISNLTDEVIKWKDKYYQLLEKHNSFLEEKL